MSKAITADTIVDKRITNPIGRPKGNNFMTPHIMGYGKTPTGVMYELSKGKGFHGETIYGITFLPWKRIDGRNGMCHSIDGCLEHINSL